MDSIIFEQEWQVGDIFEYALISDSHIRPGEDNVGIKNTLEYCKKKNIRISFNGDLADFIKVKDPRYNKAEDKARIAGILNEEVEYVADFLAPYADLIDIIGMGNHEGSLLIHDSYDAIRAILRDLNRVKTNGVIHYGSYQGFMTYRFKYKKGSRAMSFQILRHHGKGGNAPVTGGAIDLERMFATYGADLMWVGHKHAETTRGKPFTECNQNGHVKQKIRRGIITPGFQSQHTIHDNNKNGGSYDYSDTFYGTVPNGWALLRIEPYNKGNAMELDWTVTMMN